MEHKKKTYIKDKKMIVVIKKDLKKGFARMI